MRREASNFELQTINASIQERRRRGRGCSRSNRQMLIKSFVLSARMNGALMLIMSTVLYAHMNGA
eukprot:1146521-Pelagomonas_calceolata.AAC.4